MSDRALGEILAHLEECPDLCEVDYSAVQPDLSADDLVYLLVAIRDARAAYATLYDVVEHDLLPEMGERNITVDGVGFVEVKKAKRRTGWQNHDLTIRVVARALDERKLDETTGEYESEGAAVARVLEACARPNWRMGPLRALGLDPDDWCTVEEGAYGVKLPGREL